jgi:hypothetical protein
MSVAWQEILRDLTVPRGSSEQQSEGVNERCHADKSNDQIAETSFDQEQNSDHPQTTSTKEAENSRAESTATRPCDQSESDQFEPATNLLYVFPKRLIEVNLEISALATKINGRWSYWFKIEETAPFDVTQHTTNTLAVLSAPKQLESLAASFPHLEIRLRAAWLNATDALRLLVAPRGRTRRGYEELTHADLDFVVVSLSTLQKVLEEIPKPTLH